LQPDCVAPNAQKGPKRSMKNNLAIVRDIITGDEIGERGPDFQPLYRQVKALLIRRIATGQWRPGAAVPSEMRLAAEFRVSHGTVRKAIEELAAQNLVIRRQGRGTFVATHAGDRARFHFMHVVPNGGIKQLPTGRLLSLREVRATKTQAERLRLERGTSVLNMVRVRTIGGAPVMFERISLPAERFRGLKLPLNEDRPDELYIVYEQQFGVTIVRAEERLRAVPADAPETAHLGVPAGTPLMEVERTALILDGTPVEWRVTRFKSSDHYYGIVIE
jgi:GntR family transcriptional regulator